MGVADTPQLDLPALEAARAAVPSGLWLTLTPKQQGYLAAKLRNPRITDTAAAIAAGCPKRSAKQRGSELARDPKVKAAMAAIAAGVEAGVRRDAEGVVKLLWDNAEDARKAQEYAASNQAAGTLAKIYGLLEKRIRLSVDNPEALLAQLKAMPKAERAKLLREWLEAA